MMTIRKYSAVRGLLFASACVLSGALSITPGQAKTDFGVRGGAYAENDKPFLGAEALFTVGTGQPYTVWAGAGPTLIFRDRNTPSQSDTTDTGVNLVLGVGGRKGDVRPYGQMKVVLANDTEAVVGVGVRF